MNSNSLWTQRLAVLAACCSMFTAPAIADQNSGSGDLLISTAEGLAFDGSSIVFSGVGPDITWFNDRPERMSGTISWSEFLETWSGGNDSFSNDPPNAALTIEGKIQQPVVVELSNPRIEGSNVTFDVTVLHGELPSSAGATSVVYDWCYQCADV